MAPRTGTGVIFQAFNQLDEYGSPRPLGGGGRPMMVYDDYSECDSDDTCPYSPRHSPRTHQQPHLRRGSGHRHGRDRRQSEWRWSPTPSPSPSPKLPFFIIREGSPATPPPRESHLQSNDHRQQQQYQHQYHHAHPPPLRESAASPTAVACLMERTDSGRAILTETDLQPAACPEFSLEEDRDAALRVEQHLAKPHARGNVKRHERILRTLINPRINPRDKGTPDFDLDNDALESIFSAADEIFFQGRLSRRVHWEWSSGCVNVVGVQEGGRIIGTTALRAAEDGGYETLIVLSSPILKDTSYNRRLLISTFLHEMIHSYLFICCGFKARHCGGHTAGFKTIAGLIDQWEGQGSLRLCDMEADLEHFREEPPLRQSPNDGHYPTSYHHHGGVDFYDLNATPWSTGPRVVFGAQARGNEGRWTTGNQMPVPMLNVPSPLSSGTTLVEDMEWGPCDGANAFSQNSVPGGNTFDAYRSTPFTLR